MTVSTTEAVAAVSAAGSAAGAIAAWFSARSSARGVALAHRPYVYGEHLIVTIVFGKVRLHNRGPGAALAIKWRLCSPGKEPTNWSKTYEAMQPGDTLPLDRDEDFYTPDHPADSGWHVETEFGDIRGKRWRCEQGNVRRVRRWTR